jgi:hypothetical protein
VEHAHGKTAYRVTSESAMMWHFLAWAGLLDAPRCVRCKVPAPGGAVAIFGPKDHRLQARFPFRVIRERR